MSDSGLRVATPTRKLAVEPPAQGGGCRPPGWGNPRPETHTPASRPPQCRVCRREGGSQPWSRHRGAASRRSAATQPFTPLGLPDPRLGGPRGAGAHLIFLTDVDKGRDAHGEGLGATATPLANHADRKKEQALLVAPHNRFRVTVRGGLEGRSHRDRRGHGGQSRRALCPRLGTDGRALRSHLQTSPRAAF